MVLCDRCGKGNTPKDGPVKEQTVKGQVVHMHDLCVTYTLMDVLGSQWPKRTLIEQPKSPVQMSEFGGKVEDIERDGRTIRKQYDPQGHLREQRRIYEDEP